MKSASLALTFVLLAACSPGDGAGSSAAAHNSFDATGFMALEGETTDALVARLGYAAVQAATPGADAAAAFPGGVTFAPDDAFPDGRIARLAVYGPGPESVDLTLSALDYIDGRVETGQLGVVLVRTNYAERVADLSASLWLAPAQVDELNRLLAEAGGPETSFTLDGGEDVFLVPSSEFAFYGGVLTNGATLNFTVSATIIR